ncbi:LysM peptidoglycan-binding domain-containing protein [Algimonas porphyrae]|uniref:LysM domain-containing protein n=1 Tax=Algimonas porphyrae TaxID=1128113 RepID=A0ABQ5UYF3_9PROT|nr:LysM peptidoglycan-binding domain-containing protein [Algimonas porphyrae]GLQ20236.1 hypothetical protein GCM10007854_11910 [Algimonas porphyrae]
MRIFLSAVVLTSLSSAALSQDSAALSDDQLQAKIDAAVMERQQAALKGGQYQFALPLIEIPLYAGTESSDGQHTVADGDTLYGLSKRYGVNIADIQQVNALKGYSLALGQTLRIPSQSATRTIPATYQSGVSSSQAKPGESVYMIQSGDTLFGIARRYCLKPADFMTVNRGVSANRLRIGSSLQIPAAACTPKSTDID